VKIDAHQHFWRYAPARHTWITGQMAILKRDYLPEHLSKELSANGMDGCVAVQADQSKEETGFLLDLARENPFIRGVIGWVDLRARNLPERLEYYARFEKLRGFRHIAQSEPDDFLTRPDVIQGIRSLRSFGLTYDILIYPNQLRAAIALVERLPDQRFVLDHIAKPAIRTKSIEDWAAGIRAIAAHPTVYCKVSGLITEADWGQWEAADFRPYLDVVFEAFGVDRLMFGSDWPVCLLAGTYGQVKKLIADHVSNWPAEAQERIFGLNAAEFYGFTA
jgi:L-fuconolactonase